jgi:hypothetical protein
MERSDGKKADIVTNMLFTVDILLCVIIMILLAISLHQNYQGRIYKNEYVERISLLSSAVGLFLAFVISFRLISSRSGIAKSFLLMRMCLIGGIFHFICALSLIYYYATWYGYLPIIVGHVYREYGYIQLINALFYFGIFAYFMGWSRLIKR